MQADHTPSLPVTGCLPVGKASGGRTPKPRADVFSPDLSTVPLRTFAQPLVPRQEPGLRRERRHRLPGRSAGRASQVAGRDVDDHRPEDKDRRHPEERAAVNPFPRGLPRMMINEVGTAAAGRKGKAHDKSDTDDRPG
ncbi:MAG: hypothetical protein RL091_2380 [Verrucomicrobiota bacterium]|jgi:hypothetical protein